MDFLKSAVNAYQESQGGGQQHNQQGGQQNYGNNQEGGDYGVTGGSRFNSSSNSMPASQLAGDLDDEAVVGTANDDSGNSGDRDLFGTAMGFLKGGNHQVDDNIDEDDVMQKHDQAYSQGNASNMSAQGMGAAAALQAMKRFTSGGGAQAAPSASGNGQSALIGMAMSEASKLFDQSGGAAGGNKQDAVNSAGMMIMKMMLKSQMGGSTGGMGSMLSMASKFM